MALETRMDMVQFPSPQDIQRGLPHRGQDWVSRLEERYSGTVSADLMLLRVGALITDAKPALADLKGDCQGATHFVRSVDLGARALSASAGSTPLKTPFGESAVQRNDVLERDGEVQACQRREAGAQHPPDQCRAPLKLDLDPLIRK